MLLCVGASGALAGDPVYPAGDTTQVHDERTFQLRVPEAPAPAGGRPFLLSLGGSLTDFDSLQDDGFVVCIPRPRVDPTGKMWSGGEVKEVLALVDHLAKVLSIDRSRLHAVAFEEGIHTIFSLTVFGDASRFVSATFWMSHYRGGSVAGRAKKGMGVLGYAWTPSNGGEGTSKLVEQLEGKVRSVEVRDDAQGLSGPYFRWWLRTMEGRFVPGEDLSFDWIPAPPALQDLQAQMGVHGQGAFVWVFAKEDADSKGARALQIETFLDPRVRRAGKSLLCVKIDRASAAAWAEALAVKATPTLIVLRPDGTHAARFEGEAKVGPLAKAMEGAAR